MNVYRQQINEILAEAKQLAHNTMFIPQPDKVYLVNVGRYQQLLTQARLIKEKYLDPEQAAGDAHEDLPDEDETITPPRSQDRLQRSRQNHRPRSI